MVSGKYLQLSQRMNILRVAMEALTSDDASDRQMGSDIVYMAMRDPESWLTDVPEILRYIHKTVEQIRMEPARNSLDSLLLLTRWSSRGVVSNLLRISPTCDSAAMAMWEVLISTPQDLWTIMLDLVDVLQDCRERRVFSSAMDDACIYTLFLLVCTDIDNKEFAALYNAQRFLRRPSPVMLSLVLTGLITLSKTPEMARKMLVMLPNIMENLLAANADVRMKALMLFINIMGHMKREEANLISLSLAEKLLPLFDDASRDTLSTCGEFLGWRRLSSVARTWQTDVIGHCLITHRRSRVDRYLFQSLPYLKDPQATVREAAVRFIGLAVRRRRILSREKLWEIGDALLPLREDSEPSISSLAVETVSVLTEQILTSRWSLRWLCCWLC